MINNMFEGGFHQTLRSFIAILSSIALCSQSHASLLVQALSADELKFNRFLSRNRAELESGPTFFLNRGPQPNDEEMFSRLRQDFLHAQQQFLSASNDEAKKQFAAVTLYSLKADWTKQHRRMVFDSFLRVAQLNLNDAKTARRYLHEANDFAPDLKADTNLFPPPVINMLNEVRKKNGEAVSQIDFSQELALDEVLLVNGRPFKSDSGVFEYNPTKAARFSLYTNQHMPISQVTTALDIASLRRNAQPILSGTCENPIVDRSMNFKYWYGYFDDTCVIQFDGQDVKTRANAMQFGGLPESKLEKYGLSASGGMSGSPNAHAEPNLILQNPRTSSTSWNRKWLWVGIGSAVLIASAIVIMKSQENKNTETNHDPGVQPTHNDGN